jgi:hypothetical protein
LQVAVADGFGQKPRGVGGPHTRGGDLVDVGTEIDHRDQHLCLDTLGGFHAVYVPLQVDIHEHQIWPVLQRLRNGLRAGRRQRDHRIAEPRDPTPQVEGDNPFILDNEEACEMSHRLGV